MISPGERGAEGPHTMWAGQQCRGGVAGSVDASAAGRLPQAAGCQSDWDIHSHAGSEEFIHFCSPCFVQGRKHICRATLVSDVLYACVFAAVGSGHQTQRQAGSHHQRHIRGRQVRSPIHGWVSHLFPFWTMHQPSTALEAKFGSSRVTDSQVHSFQAWSGGHVRVPAERAASVWH